MSRPLSFLLAAAVPLLLYARTASFGFVQADDAALIAGNQAFLSETRNAPRAFTRSYFEVEGELTDRKTYYRPLAIVSFMLDAARSGADPGAYHVTNAALHALVTCLLLAIARAWGAPPGAALAAALLFAVHPLNVQAVAWIAGRNDLLLAAFGLLSLLGFADLSRRKEAGDRRKSVTLPPPSCLLPPAVAQRFSAAIIHVLAFAGALFSKETGLFLLPIALLHHAAVERRPLSGAQKAVLATDVVAIAAWAWLRARALTGMPSDLGVDSVRTLGANAPQLLSILRKMVFPVALNVAPGVHDIDLALAALTIALFAFLSRRLPAGRAAVAVAWVLAFLLPTLLVPGLPAYEHRAYVPMLGVLAALALLGTPREGAPTPLVRVERAFPARLMFLALLVMLAAGAWQRQEVFRDPMAYWTDASRDARFGPLADVNLGQLAEAAGRPADARQSYLRALERDPHTPKAHNNLGVVLMQSNEATLARAHFEEEARRHPWNADAWFNLGLWAEMHGDPADARRHYERAIAENRAYRPAYEKLGLTPPR